MESLEFADHCNETVGVNFVMTRQLCHQLLRSHQQSSYDTNCCARSRPWSTCETATICITCKIKILQSKLAVQRQKSRKEYDDLMWFDSNLAYIHGKRIWESFINKLGTRDLTFPLIPTWLFTFLLIPSI